jgi:hypothetical protein
VVTTSLCAVGDRVAPALDASFTARAVILTHS